MFFNRQREEGFTLVELLIVVTIIGILASIVLPRFLQSTADAKKKAHKADRQAINAQLELYYFDEGAYPVGGGGTAVNLNTWTTNYASYFPDGVPSANNEGATWKIKNGRVSLEDMTGGPFE